MEKKRNDQGVTYRAPMELKIMTYESTIAFAQNTGLLPTALTCPFGSYVDKFKIEEIRGRLMSLAKKQINTILSDNLEHAHNLQTKIASLPQGHTLWQDIMN